MFTIEQTLVLMLTLATVASIGVAYLFFHIGHKVGSQVHTDVATEEEIEAWMNDLRHQRSQARLFDQEV